MTRYVPVLPESAPFTPEQRAYLNGYLAGLFSFVPVPATGTPPATATLKPLTILFGSQTGTTEKLAKRVMKEASQRGFAPTVQDLAKYPCAQLASEETILVLTSTYGDGDPPDNAKAFWNCLKSESAPRMEKLRYSVCALGDSNYPRFCQFGKDLDALLEARGAQRIHPRQDCDVEYERPFQAWLSAALTSLGSASPSTPTLVESGSKAEPETSTWSRSNPYPAQLKTNRRLGGEGSAKDVRHFEFALADSSFEYEVGDALGVWPTNSADLVHDILLALGCDGEEAVKGRDDRSVPLRLALQSHYEIGRISPGLLEYFARESKDKILADLLSPTANGELQKYLYGRDVLDLLLAHPQVRPSATDFTQLLRKLQPRLYSISSSLRAHPGEVHLTVNAVRYCVGGRSRHGVASCFLADRCGPEGQVPIFVHSNPAFRPPPPETPMIMIGPGTGIAPFRAFLQERKAVGARGRNWLFFGDQHAASDFLYQNEIENFVRDGVLTRLDLAWSRDQAEKIYVQHRMLESAGEIWRWLEDGAAVLVCGDASRMAKDVDATLHRIIEQAGRTPEQAAAYIQELQASKRYCRDVY